MANGFFLGGFGQGLTSGLTTGAGIQDARKGRELQERQLKQQEEEARRKPFIDARERAMQTFKDLGDVITEASKNRGPEAAIALLESADIQSVINTAVEASNLASQSLGENITLTPEQALTSLRVKAQAQASAREKGVQAGVEAASEAGVVAEAIGGTAEQKQANFASLLGISEGSQPEFVQLLNALGQAQPGSPEAQALQGRINRLSAAEGGGFFLRLNPDGSFQLGQGAVGQAGFDSINAEARGRLIASGQELETGLEIVDFLLAQVEQNPGFFGASGTVRRGAQTAGSMAEDLLNNVPLGPGLTEAVRAVGGAANGLFKMFEGEVENPDDVKRLAPATTGDLAVLQSVLRFKFARALQPRDKLLASTIDDAENAVNLTGLTGSRQVREALIALRPQFESSLTDVQRQLQLGVQGQTSVPPASAVRSEPAPRREPISDAELQSKPVEEMTDEELQSFLRRLLEIL